MNNYNTPDIFTDRLVLRKFTKDDTQDLLAILSDTNVNKFLPWLPLKTLEQAEVFLKERFLSYYEKPVAYRYAVCLKEDKKPIGYINLGEGESYDFGYGLMLEYWGKGIVTEAAKAVISEIKVGGKIPYITATHDIHNGGSGAVMQKISMEYKYSYEERVQPKDVNVTFRMYQLNFADDAPSTYMEYWDKYENHFVEQV